MSRAIRVDLRTFDSTIREGLLRERLMAALSGVFGALGALIAAIGLYGVMSYLVLRRTKEFGVRIALGAQRARPHEDGSRARRGRSWPSDSPSGRCWHSPRPGSFSRSCSAYRHTTSGPSGSHVCCWLR